MITDRIFKVNGKQVDNLVYEFTRTRCRIRYLKTEEIAKLSDADTRIDSDDFLNTYVNCRLIDVDDNKVRLTDIEYDNNISYDVFNRFASDHIYQVLSKINHDFDGPTYILSFDSNNGANYNESNTKKYNDRIPTFFDSTGRFIGNLFSSSERDLAISEWFNYSDKPYQKFVCLLGKSQDGKCVKLGLNGGNVLEIPEDQDIPVREIYFLDLENTVYSRLYMILTPIDEKVRYAEARIHGSTVNNRPYEAIIQYILTKFKEFVDHNIEDLMVGPVLLEPQVDDNNIIMHDFVYGDRIVHKVNISSLKISETISNIILDKFPTARASDLFRVIRAINPQVEDIVEKSVSEKYVYFDTSIKFY